MKNEALERYTSLYQRRNKIRSENAAIFDEFDTVYNQMLDAELDLKDETVRAGKDLQNGIVHSMFIAGSKDGTIRPKAKVTIIRS